MKRLLLVPVLFFACCSAASGRGLLIPVEKEVAPLAMLNHDVKVTLEDQVAITRVVQTFRNHTSRKLEATYVFPVPAGASVRDFAMWVDGKRVKGELVKADKAKQMYTEIVRQTQNPALLEYIGSDMLTMKIFPVPPQGDQKVEVSFTAVARKELDLVEYVYPLKTDLQSASTLEEFRIAVNVKSQRPIGGIYSPTHEVTINQENDHEAEILFEQKQAQLDRDFRLFYTLSGRDIGLTALEHRPISTEDGYVMLLLSPRAELSKEQQVPRDIVFVVDTSGSMMHKNNMEQAQKALRQCLGSLGPDDRFGLISFATTVNRYRDELVPATEEQVKHAKGWVANLYAGGGTAVHEGLTSALDMRSEDNGRMFTVVFFTDGKPTIGETDTEKIMADLLQKNSASTRIFTCGIGDDLNAVFLDQLAEQTRAVSRYVRSDENLEAKVTSFFAKINHPVLANLQLTTTGDVRLAEVYPPKLPDLFHGDQLVVLARFQGAGHAAVVLDGKVGPHDKKFVYELDFEQQVDGKPFVEELWARRKVGYLLDQIRINGERKELVEAVMALAKNYGITTPYTSYLIMPDAPLTVASSSRGVAGRAATATPAALAPPADGLARKNLADFAREVQSGGRENLARSRGAFQDRAFRRLDQLGGAFGAGGDGNSADEASKAAYAEARQKLEAAKNMKSTLDKAYFNYQQGNLVGNQVNKLGVDLAVCTNELKCQNQLTANALRRVGKRTCMEIGGVWIDEAFTPKTRTVSVKAQSPAYFKILEQQPQMKEVFRLGNHVVWITPNGTGLVIDTETGKDELTDREIAALFAKM